MLIYVDLFVKFKLHFLLKHQLAQESGIQPILGLPTPDDYQPILGLPTPDDYQPILGLPQSFSSAEVLLYKHRCWVCKTEGINALLEFRRYFDFLRKGVFPF